MFPRSLIKALNVDINQDWFFSALIIHSSSPGKERHFVFFPFLYRGSMGLNELTGGFLLSCPLFPTIPTNDSVTSFNPFLRFLCHKVKVTILKSQYKYPYHRSQLQLKWLISNSGSPNSNNFQALSLKSQTPWVRNRSPKGNMWSAIPVALLCMLVIVGDG